MDLGLKDKIAVVTGASSGIGMAVAECFASEGVHLVICARNQVRLRETRDAIQKRHGVKVLTVKADVTKPEDIEKLRLMVESELPGVDILVNNAGIGSAETIMEAPDDKWNYFWDLQIMAAVRLSRALVPLMKERGGGAVINNASILSRQPLDHEPVYNVVKAALVMFSKCLSNELIQYNIRVNCINPGLILTPSWRETAELLSKEKGISAQEYLDRIARQYTPIGRFATPEEIAPLFVFLCSSRASYCVGSSFYVDGGWLKVTT
jgi:NAD(P)-dependent dehydrogenase (short-subunit alcohol dehydrogenase family)